jgi:superfamily II DNA or RNA helicase
MSVYYVVANDGRRMYYRDGARISHAEGERYNAKKRESHASCRRQGSPSIISPSTGKCIKKGTRAYKNLQKRGLVSSPRGKTPVKVDQTVKCTDNEQYNTHTGKCNKIGGRAWKNAIEKGWIKASSSRRKTPEKPSRKSPCAKNEQYNTNTGKCNKIGGRAWKNAVEKGWIKASSSRRKTPGKSPRKTPQQPARSSLCAPNEQYNTHTGKCNKIGGRAWKNAVENGWIKASSSRRKTPSKPPRKTPSKSPRKTPAKLICNKGQQYNTYTGKCNKIGGRAWKNAVDKGWITEKLLPSVSRGSSSGSLIGNVSLPKKKNPPTADGDKCEGVVCEDGKICSPTSGICVKIGGRVHRTLMKNGMVPLIDLPSPKSKKRPLVRDPVVRPKEGPRWKPSRLSPKTQCVKRSNLPLTAAQLKVVQYMDTHDGLIVVHGTGCGKTLTAVTCTQCYLDQNPGHGVIFVGPASLTANFKKEMKAYGVTDISQYKFYSFDKFMRDYEAGRIDATDKFLVIDEAHNLRNPGGKKSQAVVEASYSASKRLLLTATPFVNSVMDFVPLLNIVHGKKVVGTKKEFYNNEVDEWIGKEANLHALTVIRYLIRDRIDIVDCKSKENFAERVDETIQVPMSSEYYQKYIQLTKGLPVLDDLFSDPAAFYNGYRRAVNRAGSDYFSEKVQAAAPILKRGKSIIYSNWLDFGIHPIVLALKENDISFRSFFGEVDVLDRERIIKAFNKGKFDTLIISRAGGEGIDLHGVRSVVILDPPWNDASLQQIIGRAIRYNSHAHLPPSERNVTVYQMELVYPPGLADPTTPSGKPRHGMVTGDQLLYKIIDKKNKASERVFSMLKSVSI